MKLNLPDQSCAYNKCQTKVEVLEKCLWFRTCQPFNSSIFEFRFEINQYNLDVQLWESFSTLERQNAFEERHDYVDVEFDPDNANELIGDRN